MTVVLALPPISGAPALHVETPAKLQNHCQYFNRRIFVYICCLISIGLSLSDKVSKKKFLNIERA